MYINSAEDVNKLKKLKPTEPRTKKCGLFLNSYKNFFMAPKAEDKVDDETKDNETKDDETDEQPDTTDMPELESEESAEQRREQEGKGLEILTPEQMLSRLPVSLAQLKAGNNSQKLKNEIRQLLYSLYR